MDGSLNKDVFLENFTISKFEKNWDNAMYRYYYAKIWKLICYFDEFRRYTSPNQIYRDLKNTISPDVPGATRKWILDFLMPVWMVFVKNY